MVKRVDFLFLEGGGGKAKRNPPPLASARIMQQPKEKEDALPNHPHLSSLSLDIAGCDKI
jgi:hypothetical protein